LVVEQFPHFLKTKKNTGYFKNVMVNTNCKTERMLDYFFGKLAGFTVWTGYLLRMMGIRALPN